MSPLKKMKEELKTLATEIREANKAHRAGQREASAWDKEHPNWTKYNTADYKERWKVYGKIPQSGNYLSQDFRYKFVAYCIARGRKYEEIERRVSAGNELDMARVDKIVKRVQDEQAAFRASQIRPVA